MFVSDNIPELLIVVSLRTSGVSAVRNLRKNETFSVIRVLSARRAHNTSVAEITEQQPSS